jgi:hypothetical protein
MVRPNQFHRTTVKALFPDRANSVKRRPITVDEGQVSVSAPSAIVVEQFTSSV